MLKRLCLTAVLLLLIVRPLWADATNANPTVQTALEVPRSYVLRPNDVVLIKVHQEDDLTTQARISIEGFITMPMVGKIYLASNTVDQATTLVHDLLARDYLVNPQVFITIVERAKSRFTVLGQVQRPGSYEISVGESMNLLQALAAAGGCSRLGNPRKITLQRMVNGRKEIFKLDATAMAEDKSEKVFHVLPDDTITVAEKWL